MSDWTSGYVSDIGYTFGYYTELNPLRSRLALLNAGVRVPDIKTACELGFGQGLSTNIHAAGSTALWWGTDFNPSQASFAQELAEHSQSDASLFDQSFADFCNRTDLPDFDYIGLHGIWSWISDENRRTIVDFVRRKLSVGGVLYVSYNTLPGWSGFFPLRHIMVQHSETMGAPGSGRVSGIDGALDFAQKLLESNPVYKTANPTVEDRLKKVVGQDRSYLAHEYFNKDWHPMHFADAANWLSPAKVEFACSAHYLDHFDSVNLTAQQRELLKAIPDAMMRQSVFDFMINQYFRRDYWIKGVRRLTPLEKTEALGQQRIMLASHRSDVSLKVNGGQGEAKMNESIYSPILDALEDHRVNTIGNLVTDLSKLDSKFNSTVVTEAIMVLASSGHVHLAQDEETAKSRKIHTDKLNHVLLDKARSSADVGHLASPVTGGAIAVPRIEQLFVTALHQGRNSKKQLAEHAWKVLAMQNQRIIKDGKTLESEVDNLAELSDRAAQFQSKKRPILEAAMIIPNSLLSK